MTLIGCYDKDKSFILFLLRNVSEAEWRWRHTNNATRTTIRIVRYAVAQTNFQSRRYLFWFYLVALGQQSFYMVAYVKLEPFPKIQIKNNVISHKKGRIYNLFVCVEFVNLFLLLILRYGYNVIGLCARWISVWNANTKFVLVGSGEMDISLRAKCFPWALYQWIPFKYLKQFLTFFFSGNLNCLCL